jgi:hypothetical protein
MWNLVVLMPPLGTQTLHPVALKRAISGRLQNRDSLVWSAASRPGKAILSF